LKILQQLGVKIDQELHWRQHIKYAVKKGMVLLAAVNRLTHPLFGLPTPHVHRLFMAIVVPNMEYALPFPSSHPNEHSTVD